MERRPARHHSIPPARTEIVQIAASRSRQSLPAAIAPARGQVPAATDTGMGRNPGAASIADPAVRLSPRPTPTPWKVLKWPV